MNPTRITILIPHMNQGGAQRVVAYLANAWCDQQHTLSLITWDTAENDTHALNPSINRIGLDLMHESQGLIQAIQHNRERLKQLRSAIRDTRPDVVVSFIDVMNVMTLLATRQISCGKIISERVDPRHHQIGRIWSWLRRYAYRLCDRLVVQTKPVADYCERYVAREKITVIPNAVFPDESAIRPNTTESALSERVVIAMGRLVPQKGFDLLIAAFDVLADKHPDWKLRIYGEGPQRKLLQQQIHQLGRTGQIELKGWVSDAQSHLMQSEIFVLSSRYEGFPNVLLEAMACGLPVVSFDCESGPADIIRDRIDGILVPAADTGQLVVVLDELMSDSKKRVEMGSKATEVPTRFSPEKFISSWNRLLEETSVSEQRNQK